MSLTPSTMLELGTQAPDFELPDTVSGETISLNTFTDKKGLLVMFICNHCPYVKHINEQLGRLGSDYADSDIGIVAISANDAGELSRRRARQAQGVGPATWLSLPVLP